MIKKVLIAMMGIVTLIAWNSCTENLEDSKNSLEVSPSSDLSFGARGNEDVVLTISTNASSYEVATESWVVYTKTSNSLTVNVEDNLIAATREGQLTITAGTADPVVINIYQEAGEEDYISSEPTQLLFKAQDEPKELSISSNVEDWSYSLDFGDETEEWFSVEQTDNILTVSVTDYDEIEGQREGSIELSAGDATLSVPIIQAAKDIISVSPASDIELAWNDSQGVTLTVSTTADSWVLSVSYVDGSDWLSYEADESSVKLSVSQNDSQDSRSATLTFSGGDADEVVLSVTQSGKPAPVNATLLDQSGNASVETELSTGQESYSTTVKLTLNEVVDASTGAVTATVIYDESYTSGDYTALPISALTLGNEGKFTIAADGSSTSAELSVGIDLSGLEDGTQYFFSLYISEYSDNITMEDANRRVNYLLTTATTIEVQEKNKKNLLILECNDTNPLNALELKYVDNTPFFQGVVLFSSNIIADESTHQVVFSYNNNVQALLNEKAKYVEPLQDAGIKVYLSLLPHHTAAGLGNLREEAARSLAAEVADVVKEHKLDGVFLDNEYTGTYDEAWSDLLYSSSSDAHYARFAYELKQALNSACDWDTDVILYQVNGEVFTSITGMYTVSASTYIDLAMPDYSISYSSYNDDATTMGFGSSQKFCYAVTVKNYLSTSQSTRLSSAETWKSRDAEWIGLYNLVLDPNADTFNWDVKVPVFFAGLANLVNGCDIQAPTGYYKKLGEGSYSDTRYEYEFTMLYNGKTWDEVWW